MLTLTRRAALASDAALFAPRITQAQACGDPDLPDPPVLRLAGYPAALRARPHHHLPGADHVAAELGYAAQVARNTLPTSPSHGTPIT